MKHKKGVKETLKQESKGFKCANCSQIIGVATHETAGTEHRDHCPLCLSSMHVDEKPGDRASGCHAFMRPIGMTFKRDGKEPMVVYECGKCGVVHKNRCAADDSEVAIVDVLRKSFDITGTSEVSGQNERMQHLKEKLREAGIVLVKREDADIFLESIFGRGHIPEGYKREFSI